MSDPRQPEVDFLHSWAVVLPKRSGESSADLLPPGILKGKKALISGCLGLLKNAFSQAPQGQAERSKLSVKIDKSQYLLVSGLREGLLS